MTGVWSCHCNSLYLIYYYFTGSDDNSGASLTIAIIAISVAVVVVVAAAVVAIIVVNTIVLCRKRLSSYSPNQMSNATSSMDDISRHTDANSNDDDHRQINSSFSASERESNVMTLDEDYGSSQAILELLS
jgi:mannitol-specific phosphotransferase system IIBC component